MYLFKRNNSLKYQFLNTRALLLSVFWLTGLFLGLHFAYETYDAVRFVLLSFFESNASILSAILVFLFPFALSVLFVLWHKYYLLLALVFCKAFCYSYCCCVTSLMFQSAAWLLRFLLFLPDTIVVAALFWFWARSYVYHKNSVGRDLLFCIIPALIAGVTSYIFSLFLFTLHIN